MNESEAPRASESSWRFKKGFELAGSYYKKISVTGQEHLDLPPNDRVIFVTTHISDADVPVAASVLASRFDLGIGYISALMEHPKLKWIFGTEKLILGPKNFFPIDYSLQDKKWKSKGFNPKNYEPMIAAIKQGKTMLMAAHNPTYDLTLPDKGGIGAIWLAQKTNAKIIPVAINLHVQQGVKSGAIESLSKKPFHRPDIDVIIGKPITLPPINTDIASKETLLALRTQSNSIMEQLASMLPENKRGTWKNPTVIAS